MSRMNIPVVKVLDSIEYNPEKISIKKLLDAGQEIPPHP